MAGEIPKEPILQGSRGAKSGLFETFLGHWTLGFGHSAWPDGAGEFASMDKLWERLAITGS
jgi:hypothetical protein